MTYSDDKTAIINIQNGNKKAFEFIYKKYFHLLCNYATKIVGCLDIAEDIVQDVFEKIWKEHETIHIIESLQAYLHTSIRNKCLDYIDNIKVKNEHVQTIIDDNEAFPIHYKEDPMSIMIAKETERRINDKIETFSEQCRDVFLLWWKAGLKYDKIAERLGISLGTVKTQINRARTKLREYLKHET